VVLYDFCLWPYEPLVDPRGKRPFRDLLSASFDCVPGAAALEEVRRQCTEAFGENAVVWGVRQGAHGLSWELYFYDYARQQRRVSIDSVRKALALPPLEPGERLEHLPYFMCSVEVDAHGQVSPLIDVYVGTPGSEVSAGLCYAFDGKSLTFKNLYHFYETARSRTEVLDQLACSMHLPSGFDAIDSLLWPQVADCRTLVVANKRLCDGLYYSRVDASQALWFMRRCRFAGPLVTHLERNLADYAHLLFDLGVDFRNARGRLDFFRSAFYGVV
jgi:hypothetical protein